MDVTLNREPRQGWLRVTSHLDEPPRLVAEPATGRGVGSGTTGGAGEVAAYPQPQAAAVVKIGQYDRVPLAERMALSAERLAAEPARPPEPPTWLQIGRQHFLRGVAAGGLATYRFYLHDLDSKL